MGAAVEFVHEAFPGMYPGEPAFANVSSGVRFERIENSLEAGYAWIWKSGRIDRQSCADVEILEGDLIVFNVMDVVQLICQMSAAIDTATYWKIYKPKRRLLPRRFDWYISVSTGINRGDGLTVSWNDVMFPGRRPKRAGGAVQAVCPPVGYATQKLRDWKPRHGVSPVLELFLRDFLEQNGFYDCEEAIQDIRESI